MTITGTGYVPGDVVEISDSLGGLVTSGTADADGNISIATQAPDEFFSAPGTKTDTITATDDAADLTATTTTLLAPLDAAAGKTKRAPGLKAFSFTTKWTFSGFPENSTIYGHYLYRGKQVARQAFGTAVGPCGTLIVKKPVYPATAKHRSYGLQVDDAKPYAKTSAPKIVSKLTLSVL